MGISKAVPKSGSHNQLLSGHLHSSVWHQLWKSHFFIASVVTCAFYKSSGIDPTGGQRVLKTFQNFSQSLNLCIPW